ncbi:MAG: 1-acyl-sn-glycerol-3-phosphate acyltransferase [Crocinitomicaceae bacterium]|nr:1-acyl-sn-glycerol-3-phosphate acyltransferase [Crocinitomicaceae bacterium]MBK9592702.1 1-acyl-sn-glycerol-3-phosphate acyltransferase [Crocinitomicaceae bacterium]
MALFKRNIFNQSVLLKKSTIRFFGSIVYFRFNYRYKARIEGAELFQKLPDQNVLIISNHQTYFADVSFFFHAIYAAISGRPNTIKYPGFLRCKKHNIYYVAAEETMKAGFLPKLLALSGAVTINRSWRANGQNVRRKVDRSETQNIDKALQDGWLITFPQGTTTPYAPGRIGTAIIAKKHKPIVVPVVIDGFRRSFDKKGLRKKMKNSELRMRIKPPLEIDYSKTVEEIMAQMMEAIEQSPNYNTMAQIKKQEPK